jgi:hypothetical protein
MKVINPAKPPLPETLGEAILRELADMMAAKFIEECVSVHEAARPPDRSETKRRSKVTQKPQRGAGG